MNSDCVNVEGPAGNTYGHVRLPRRGDQERWAHRRAWVEAHGPIPDGLSVRHSCDNPRCVNVAHLLLGTVADNQRDMAERKRGRNQSTGATRCKNGHLLDGPSVYVSGNHRRCTICFNAYKRERRRLRG